jgi:hypothetical protein
MQRSTLLTVTGIIIIVASCLALVAALSMALFLWFEYLIPSHLGSVRGVMEAFYIELSITIFELSAFIVGIYSAVNTFKSKKFSLSVMGTSFLLIAGFLLYAKYLYNYLPHVEAVFTSFWSPIIPQPWFGLPIIIIASISLILLVSRRKEFNNIEIKPLEALKAVLILCSITSASFALLSLVPYEQAQGHFAYTYPVDTMIVNFFIVIFTSVAATLVIKKKCLILSIPFTILSLVSALSLPFLFLSNYPWIGEFYKGLMTESPVIVLSAVALALAVVGQRTRKQVIPEQSHTL